MQLTATITRSALYSVDPGTARGGCVWLSCLCGTAAAAAAGLVEEEGRKKEDRDSGEASGGLAVAVAVGAVAVSAAAVEEGGEDGCSGGTSMAPASASKTRGSMASSASKVPAAPPSPNPVASDATVVIVARSSAAVAPCSDGAMLLTACTAP